MIFNGIQCRSNSHLILLIFSSCGEILRGHKIKFYSLTTSFYTILVEKTFLCVLTYDSMHLIGHYVS